VNTQPRLDRRTFLGSLLAAPQIARNNPRDIRINSVEMAEESYIYRTPIKFGGTVVDRVTLLNVKVRVSDRGGRAAEGFGSMPLGNVWSYPSKTLTYDQTLRAMQDLSREFRRIMADCREYGHPIELNHMIEPQWLKVSGAVPKLCALVVGSPFDAAVHDAYGKLHKVSTYHTYTREYLAEGLDRYLGPDFKGDHLERYVLKEPKPKMPLYHLVGAVDPIVEADIQKRINDGLPETLPEWINYNGLTNIKIKLNGDNLDWDTERCLKVDRVSAETMARRGTRQWFYSLDFNEKCPNVQYLLEMLGRIKQKAPAGFERIQYIEQPTARDLKANRQNVMHEASKLRPVVIDESLTDLENLILAREMGYTGAALKACKGQAQALLMAAAAQKYKMFLCVQDLTCPGASLIHSAGLAAHVPGVAAIEANARQYVPAANKGWEEKFPAIFVIKDGQMRTGVLNGLGLSAI
jgi:L-alanine-DL-glutamate epimerase-like enolase superfamily enzyme